MTVKNTRGPVSFGLLSMQLQLQTLLEECGGEQAVEFLDTLSELPGKERQHQLLQVFGRATRRILESDLPEQWDEAFCNELEEELFEDIMKLMKNGEEEPARRFEVLNGGKDETNRASVVTIEELRKARQNGIKPAL